MTSRKKALKSKDGPSSPPWQRTSDSDDDEDWPKGRLIDHEFHVVLKVFLESVANDAYAYMQHRRETVMKKKDVHNAVKRGFPHHCKEMLISVVSTYISRRSGGEQEVVAATSDLTVSKLMAPRPSSQSAGLSQLIGERGVRAARHGSP
eukprot:3007035-Prymnesium_polylepis.1